MRGIDIVTVTPAHNFLQEDTPDGREKSSPRQSQSEIEKKPPRANRRRRKRQLAKRPAAPKRPQRKLAAPVPPTRLDKSVEHLRQSLERSVTLSRERLQEVVDDAVKRGRITRGDAEKLLSDLVNRGRKQTDSLLKELERLVKQARREVGGRAEPVRKQATQAARRARKKLS